MATADTFPPGSTFKTITASAVYNLMPSLSNFDFPYASSTRLPNSNQLLQNDGGTVCGGGIDTMLPQSCDPGFGLLGIALGAPTLAQQAALFGYNTRPPVDLPDSWVATPYFPPASQLTPPNQAFLAYSAIGQYNDKASALSNAMVAAGIANGGAIMTPHFMEQITDSQGDVVTSAKPTLWKQAESKAAATKLTALMHQVVLDGHSGQCGLPRCPRCRQDRHGADRQPAGEHRRLDDRVRPGLDPQIAVAVVVRLVRTSSTPVLALPARS